MDSFRVTILPYLKRQPSFLRRTFFQNLLPFNVKIVWSMRLHSECSLHIASVGLASRPTLAVGQVATNQRSEGPTLILVISPLLKPHSRSETLAICQFTWTEISSTFKRKKTTSSQTAQWGFCWNKEALHRTFLNIDSKSSASERVFFSVHHLLQLFEYIPFEHRRKSGCYKVYGSSRFLTSFHNDQYANNHRKLLHRSCKGVPPALWVCSKVCHCIWSDSYKTGYIFLSFKVYLSHVHFYPVLHSFSSCVVSP